MRTTNWYPKRAIEHRPCDQDTRKILQRIHRELEEIEEPIPIPFVGAARHLLHSPSLKQLQLVCPVFGLLFSVEAAHNRQWYSFLIKIATRTQTEKSGYYYYIIFIRTDFMVFCLILYHII